MDPALAGRYGVSYVHAVVFAIDVDRVRDARDGLDDELPFAWEVFLTEAYLVAQLDADDETACSMIEDVCLSILERQTGELMLGAQLPFAVYDAVERGRWPQTMRRALRGWKARPKEMVQALAPLWRDERVQVRRLAQACLDTELSPPMAPPSLETLTLWAAAASAT